MMNLCTKELLGASSGFNDFHNAGSQSFDGRNVVGQNTHITGFCRNVYLDHVLVGENCLMQQHVDEKAGKQGGARTWWGRTNESFILSATSA